MSLGIEDSVIMVMNYFRPTWTCGRYEKETHSAIFYNLLEGLSYFFEGDSADVIGEILAVMRGSQISIENVSKNTNIDVESLTEFFSLLEECRLLSFSPITSELISYHRYVISNNLRKGKPLQINSNSNNAENAYADHSNSRIIFALLELTYKCSEKCIHCYNPGASRNNEEKDYRNQFEELDFNDYKRIIDELYDEGLVKVCLSGGDPFSKSIVWEIIDYLYQKEIAFEIYTNGQNLFGKEEKLANYFPCDIGMSIYSSEPQIHDKITSVNGSFEKSIKVLDKLLEYSIPICIKCCVMRANLKTYIGVSNIAKRYNATLQLECAIFDSFDGDICVSKYLRLHPNELELVLRDKNNPLYVGSEIPDYGKIHKDINDIGCRAGIQNFCITPTGNLIPCCSYHAVLGNLKEKHLSDILNSDVIKKLTTLKLEKYEECGKHIYCDFCKLCPGLNFAEHGTPIKAAENNCYVAKIRYHLALRLKENDDPLNENSLESALDLLPEIPSIKVHRTLTTNHFDKALDI